ncbi:tetratricopeptide repeat protein [Bacteroidota bacterium]
MKYKFFINIVFLNLLTVLIYSQNINILSDEDATKIGEYLELSDYYNSVDDYSQAVYYTNSVAFIYWENGNINEAINYFLESASINEKAENYEDIKVIYSNIALMYTDIEELDKALEYFYKSLEIRRKLGDQKDIASGLIDVAYIAGIVGDYEGSNDMLDEALEISLELEYPSLILSCYNLLSENYNQIGDLKKSQQFREKYEEFDSYTEKEIIKEEYAEREQENLIEIEKTRAEKRAKEAEFQLRQLQFQLTQDSMNVVVQAQADSLEESERISRLAQQEIQLLEQEQQLQEAKFAEEQSRARVGRLIIYSVSVGLVLVVIMAILTFRNFRFQRKTNIELEAKNIEIENKSEELASANLNITKSINYAQGIQRALLPRQELLNTYIPESFILFKPRDIVSGDFYWFAEIDNATDLYETKKESLQKKDGWSFEDFEFLPVENNKFAISSVDCTGHGVPGAFMSMIGYNLLDEIIGNGISRADMILNELHKGVRRTLKQDITENRDGMDISLCVINKVERTVEYAGAENPLLYIQNGEIVQIKGDRNPIGGLQTEKKRVFTPHIIKIDKPSWFYIFSDGYIDQFGGSKGRKFLIANLRNLIMEIHEKPMIEQRQILDDAFSEWIGEEYKQIDDVLVIGFKLG